MRLYGRETDDRLLRSLFLIGRFLVYSTFHVCRESDSIFSSNAGSGKVLIESCS